MRAAAHSTRATADRVLDVAERLVQTQGYNGFSYADIAARIGITKASLHYHFPTKANLGERLILRYHEAFMGALELIEESKVDPADRLRLYVGLYAAVLRKKRMCLCGMLAAEHVTLPKGMKVAVRGFFDANERWLADQLRAGLRAGSLRVSGEPRQVARVLLSSLEGAMLLARSCGEPERFDLAAQRLLADLGASTR